MAKPRVRITVLSNGQSRVTMLHEDGKRQMQILGRSTIDWLAAIGWSRSADQPHGFV